MLYTVAIAVCLFSVDVRECNQVSAITWMVAPEPAVSISGCMIEGMERAASSGVVARGSYTKVFCRAGGQAWPCESAT